MAKGDLTIEGVRKAKAELESNITKLLKEFEDTYDVKLGSFINVSRKGSKSLEVVEDETAKDEVENNDINEVDINMDIDLF